MNQAAFIQSLPIAVALAVFLLLLCAFSVVMLSLRKPVPVRPPVRRDRA